MSLSENPLANPSPRGYRMREHAALIPENLRANHAANLPAVPKRRGRPPTKEREDHQTG